jgi:hypothetical protein
LPRPLVSGRLVTGHLRKEAIARCRGVAVSRCRGVAVSRCRGVLLPVRSSLLWRGAA